jgi:hypothetical protein
LPGSVLRSSLGSGRIPLPQVPRRRITLSRLRRNSMRTGG